MYALCMDFLARTTPTFLIRAATKIAVLGKSFIQKPLR